MSQTSILSTKTLSVEQRQDVFDLLEQDFIEIKITFELDKINNNLIFSSQNAVLSLMEQNG
jgi:uroporphyrinogen-III synthase